MSRLKERYQDTAVPTLTKEFGYTSVMAVPKLERVVVNMGLGEATQNVKVIDAGAGELTRITGQKPLTTRAKKSIAQFKVRQGVPIGSMVTLRRDRMYEFLDRLISIALPRVRDFRGVSPKGFDGRGNYNVGVKEQIIFPEIEYDKIDASCLNLFDAFTNFFLANTEGPLWYQVSGVGDWCVGESLADDADLQAAALKVGNILKDRFFPFRVNNVSG